MTNGNLAAIDLGTNSCRLMITDCHGKTLYKDRIATKLGEGMYANMCFTPEAVERGLNAFKTYAGKLAEYDVKKYRAIATASCRMASNGAQFIEQVKRTSGIKIDVIDGQEEAMLNLKGALLNAPKNAQYALVYDLGGGSTELTLATIQEKPKIIHTVSIPWGGRNAAEAFNLQDYNPENTIRLAQEIRSYVDDFVAKSDLAQYRENCCLIATSSTPLRLSAMIKQPQKYNREEFDGVTVRIAELDNVIKQVFTMSPAERQASPYIGKNRAPIFVSACTIFKTIYDGLGFDKLTASLKSAQEGLIGEMVKHNKLGQKQAIIGEIIKHGKTK